MSIWITITCKRLTYFTSGIVLAKVTWAYAFLDLFGLDLTILAHVFGTAFAHIVVGLVGLHAGAIVQARTACALVNVDLACAARESRQTSARKVVLVGRVVNACAKIMANMGLAWILVLFASVTFKTKKAYAAVKSTWSLFTGSIQTWRFVAGINF